MAEPRKEFIEAAKAGDLTTLRVLLASDGVRNADGSTALLRDMLHNTNEHKRKSANAGYRGVYSYQV
jgi:hypothetical protein